MAGGAGSVTTSSLFQSGTWRVLGRGLLTHPAAITTSKAPTTLAGWNTGTL
jgi:hypothetical protein